MIYKKKRTIIAGIMLISLMLFAGCTQEKPKATAAPATTQAPPATEAPPSAELIAHGGRLYDKWWGEMGADEPTEDHPLWATQSTNTRSGKDTWRCKECHGWDYKGIDGAYASGSHSTGFTGIYEAAQAKTSDELTAVMKGGANPDHDFTATLTDTHIEHVVLFLKHGLVDMTELIDYSEAKPIGASSHEGNELFEGICAACHGADGKALNFGSEDDPEYVSTVAGHNPWEFVHKIRNGQPGSVPPMPSTIVNEWSVQNVVDVLAYAQSLEGEHEEEEEGEHGHEEEEGHA